MVTAIGLIKAQRGQVNETAQRLLEIEGVADVYSVTGEYDLAFKQLEDLTRIPGGPSYGDLRLNPMWDPLRLDPRFERILALLAPKDHK